MKWRAFVRSPLDNATKTLENYTQWFFLTYGISVTGLPAISIPCGFTQSGLPVGLQIVGRRRQEVAVLRAAGAFEAAAPWSDRLPAIVGGRAESREPRAEVEIG
jgi:Asp-tRNA(Asn)/Glu-tRNA(Gln) amidotransferase A subunit family amidase